MRKLLVALLLTAISAPAAFADILPPPKKDGKRIVNNAGQSVQPWWDEATAGWIGGIAGGSVGILGAVFGITAGLGVARRLVLASALVGALVGGCAFLVGMAALLSGQPYHVYFPLLLIGGIVAFVFGLNYPILKRRNEQIEMQKMAAMDA